MTAIPPSLIASLGALLSSIALVATLSVQALDVLRPVEPPPQLYAPARYEGVPDRPAPVFNDFISRPLFLSGRKPVKETASTQPENVVATTAAIDIPRFSGQLTGVILSNTKRGALIKMEDATSVSVSEGDAIGAWTLAEVSPDHVVFRSGTHIQVVDFAKHETGAEPAGAPSGQPLRRR